MPAPTAIAERNNASVTRLTARRVVAIILTSRSTSFDFTAVAPNLRRVRQVIKHASGRRLWPSDSGATKPFSACYLLLEDQFNATQHHCVTTLRKRDKQRISREFSTTAELPIRD
jgi:hypothetical protein